MTKDSLNKQADRADNIADQTVDETVRKTLKDAARDYRKQAACEDQPEGKKPRSD